MQWFNSSFHVNIRVNTHIGIKLSSQLKGLLFLFYVIMTLKIGTLSNVLPSFLQLKVLRMW